MKEHPDYKYRPRRKPKALLKKEPKFGFPMSQLLAPVPRLLGGPPPPPHHPLLSPDGKLELPRSLFPPFPYPFYHFGPKLPGDELASELAQLGALCPGGWWAPTACPCRPPRTPPPPAAPPSPPSAGAQAPEAPQRPLAYVLMKGGGELEPPQHVI